MLGCVWQVRAYTLAAETGRIQDYSVVFNNLKQTPQGDVLKLDNIAGPTICCAWVSLIYDSILYHNALIRSVM